MSLVTVRAGHTPRPVLFWPPYNTSLCSDTWERLRQTCQPVLGPTLPAQLEGFRTPNGAPDLPQRQADSDIQAQLLPLN